MKNSTVRLEAIEISNFKNVKCGKICFENTRKEYAASILGLYGQNGSGKTSLIDAMDLLKRLLMGQQIPANFADCVNVDAESAHFSFQFRVSCENEICTEYTAVYECNIRKDRDETTANMQQTVQYKTTVFDEVLSVSYKNNEGSERLTPMIDTRTDGVFLPASKRRLLVGGKRLTETNLLVAKQITAATARSFIFSRELANVIREQCKTSVYLSLYEALINYGNFELFIINTANSGLIAINALPLSFSYEANGQISAGSLMLQLNGVSVIPENSMNIVEKVVASMNIVLREIVPGLMIEVRDLGRQVLENGITACTVQLMSLKNSKSVPLQYESEGIKKIISVMNLLIGVYNQASLTVAIDELDSGVFEYLLGELLRIISEKGKGQLIFTSHNLRPLETLDRGFVAFTTTNPENRYIRLVNVKPNNNLRDFYYRDIMLGEQDEPVYEPTNNYDIALALREAGEALGS